MTDKLTSPSQSEAALYGLAMAAAQELEQGLGEVVLLYEERTRSKKAPTMGQLLSIIKRRTKLRPDLESDLDTALAIRNRLAHTFFREAPSQEAGARNLTTLRTAIQSFVALSAEVAALVAPYRFVTSKGDEFFLHERDVTLRGGRLQRIRFFARVREPGSVDALPTGYTVVEHPKTGLPFLKKTILEELDQVVTAYGAPTDDDTSYVGYQS
jgi:hypothetical protein